MRDSTIRDILLQADMALTLSEERTAKLLLADYPSSGLGTATNLAKKAGFSDAAIVRLVVKLGFDGFPGFQRHLLAEVEARLHSRLLVMETKRPTSADEHIVEACLHALPEVIDKTISATSAAMSCSLQPRLQVNAVTLDTDTQIAGMGKAVRDFPGPKTVKQG